MSAYQIASLAATIANMHVKLTTAKRCAGYSIRETVKVRLKLMKLSARLQEEVNQASQITLDEVRALTNAPIPNPE